MDGQTAGGMDRPKPNWGHNKLMDYCNRELSSQYMEEGLLLTTASIPWLLGGGRVVRWCWVNFQCRDVLLIWITVGQGSTALAVGAGGGCLDIFTLIYRFSFLSPSLWETARYRLKYCLKGPLSPNQPTNHPWLLSDFFILKTRSTL